MSGHSKWSTIKHKKALIDAKRGAIFGKLARAISIAARGNSDPESNSQLKDVIQRARAANMPKDKIEGAIKKVSEKASDALSEIQIEFFGPGEAAVIASGITDNSNRTMGELKKLALEFGGHVVSQGSVSWMFKRAVTMRARISDDPDAQQLEAIDAGADDVSTEENELYIVASPEHSEQVKQVLGTTLIEASLSFVSTTPHDVPNENTKTKLQNFLSALDDHEDIQDVATNAEL